MHSPKQGLKRWLQQPRSRLRVAYAVWLFGIFCYFVPGATWSPVSRFDLTRSIVEHGTLQIDPLADNTGDRSRVAEHWYSDKAPLPALMAVPAYALLRAGSGPKSLPRHKVKLNGFGAKRVIINRPFQRGLYVSSVATAGVCSVALGLVLFELLSRSLAAPVAIFGSLVVLLATPLFPYGTSLYGHTIAAAALSLGLVLLLPKPPEQPSFARLVGAGASLGVSVGAEYLSLLPLLALLATFAATWRQRREARQLIPIALGGALPAAVIAWYHWACFGAPWRTGYSFITDATFAEGHARGFMGIGIPTLEALWGLTFGRGCGLFYIAPVALVLAVGVVVQARRGDRVALCGGVAAVVLYLANAGYYMWWGGSSAAPRHLIPVLGFLAVGFPAVWKPRAGRWLCCGLGAVSIVNMLLIAGVGVEAPHPRDVLGGYAYERFLRGDIAQIHGASNLGILLGVVRGGSLGPLAAWLIAGAAHCIRRAREVEQPSSSAARLPAGLPLESA